MALNPLNPRRGTLVADPLTRGDQSIVNGTHYDDEGIGGYRIVRTEADRDAIPTNITDTLNDDGLSCGLRKPYMLVYVVEDETLFQLVIPNFLTDLTTEEERALALKSNLNWQVATFGGGGSSVWGAITGDISNQGDLIALLATKQDVSEKGIANGYASLDATGKVPAAQLPTNTGTTYRGAWDASANSPNLVDGSGTEGDRYYVAVAGDQDLGSGSQNFKVRDYVAYNGTIWEKLDNVDDVTTVFGRQGAIVAQAGDYEANLITYTPSLNITATDVQAAIEELEAFKQSRDSGAVDGHATIFLNGETISSGIPFTDLATDAELALLDAQLVVLTGQLANKQDKDTDAVAGNMAEMDGAGNAFDSGIPKSDLVLSTDTHPANTLRGNATSATDVNTQIAVNPWSALIRTFADIQNVELENVLDWAYKKVIAQFDTFKYWLLGVIFTLYEELTIVMNGSDVSMYSVTIANFRSGNNQLPNTLLIPAGNWAEGKVIRLVVELTTPANATTLRLGYNGTLFTGISLLASQSYKIEIKLKCTAVGLASGGTTGKLEVSYTAIGNGQPTIFSRDSQDPVDTVVDGAIDLTFNASTGNVIIHDKIIFVE